MPSEPHRSISVDRHFMLVEDLLRGREHDRHSLAARLGIKPAMAHRLMKAALRLPGVVERQDGRRRVIKMDLTAIAPVPSYPTAVAACFGSSLWPLFEGSSYREGIALHAEPAGEGIVNRLPGEGAAPARVRPDSVADVHEGDHERKDALVVALAGPSLCQR